MKVDSFKNMYDEMIHDDIMKKLREYFTCLKLANDHNIELYNTKYKDDPDFCLWEDESGFTHIIKKPSCVICEHCTDVWIDTITTDIYHCECGIGCDVWIDTITTDIYHCECGIGCDVNKCKTCENFKEEEDDSIN